MRAMRFAIAAVMLAVTAGQCHVLQAGLLVNVDFNYSSTPLSSPTYSGGAVLGASGDFWNGIGGSIGGPVSGSGLSLRDSTNSATSVLLAYSGQGFYDAAGSSLYTGSELPLMQDYLFANRQPNTSEPPGSVTLSGLTAGGQYRLILYSSANAAGRDTAFTVNGVTKHAIAASSGALVDGVNYVDFTTSADMSGVLSVSFARGPNAYDADLNGFQLQEITRQVGPVVPEPTSLALAGFAGIGMAAGAWRRRRQQAA